MKAVQPGQPASVNRSENTLQPEAARSSAGESTPANTALSPATAVKAPEQSAVAPRLRDQETAERTERIAQPKDAPAGPPPAFEESPLERQARVALDPPDQGEIVHRKDGETADETGKTGGPSVAVSANDVPADPPPTPTERAEAGFAETKTLASPKDTATVNVEF